MANDRHHSLNAHAEYSTSTIADINAWFIKPPNLCWIINSSSLINSSLKNSEHWAQANHPSGTPPRYVTNQPPKSTQPGHPSAVTCSTSKSSGVNRHTGSMVSTVYTRVWLWAKEKISSALRASWLRKKITFYVSTS